MTAHQFRGLLRVTADLQDGKPTSCDDFDATRALAWSFANEEISGWPSRAHTDDAQRVPTHKDAVAVCRLAIVGLMATLPLEYDLAVDASGIGRSVVRLSRPLVEPSPTSPQLAFFYPGPSLFAILAVRLVAAVTSRFGLVRCGWCGNPYPRPPHRAPEATRRHFCSMSCRHEAKKETNRDIARRRYAARRSTRDASGAASDEG